MFTCYFLIQSWLYWVGVKSKIRKKKKTLTGVYKNDPTWVTKLTEDIDSINSKEVIELLKNLFNDYLAQGLPLREALEKAKNIAKSFKF